MMTDTSRRVAATLAATTKLIVARSSSPGCDNRLACRTGAVMMVMVVMILLVLAVVLTAKVGSRKVAPTATPHATPAAAPAEGIRR